MRPSILFPIFADIATLPGVGAKLKTLLAKLAGTRIVDLIYHLPISVIDRRNMPAIPAMQDGSVVTSIVQIENHISPARPNDSKSPFKVRCYNETGFLTLVFFRAYPSYIKKAVPIGEKRVISGKVERFGGEVQIVHPEHISLVEDLASIRRVEPVYPLTAGITQRHLVKLMHNAINKIPALPEWIEPNYLQKQGWYNWHETMGKIHAPESEDDTNPLGKLRSRLAYDELLANQLALSLIRKNVKKSGGIAIKGDGSLRKALLEKLPFKLTGGQEEVIREINQDQESEEKMMRLLQGDVGSGKTVVALFAALNAVEAGKQVVFMVPTEILATQHYKWIEESVKGLGCKVALLIGKTKGQAREKILNELKNGEIDIVIGTHALFQEKVEFKELALAIIDEQHRFGVNQRMSLAQKGNNIDVLLMTATPIPRTLTLTMYGDMECSRLTDKPKGRKEIDTRIMPKLRIKQIIEGLWRVIDKKEKIYWICPLVEESEKIDLAAAEERFFTLKKIFGERVGLVHGRMKPDEREQAMLEFKSGKVDILVATTVVEVGVDVPEATVIIIEHAERFGLSQLHQLRGRVGRSDRQSSCILLYYELGKISESRLKIMRESNDGFYLAEEDLRLRGGGEILGTKQSGLPDFKVASLYDHFDLLKAANDDARLIMHNDQSLKTRRGEALRVLLYLFGYDSQVKYLQAG